MSLVIFLFLTEIVQASDFNELWDPDVTKNMKGATGHSPNMRGAISSHHWDAQDNR